MSPVHSEQIVVIAGMALLVTVVLRMLYSRWRVRRTLAVALRHPDPRVRAAAVRSAAENSVARHVSLLATLAETETHAGVIRVLAETICEHQWEPATSRTMVELRMWAYGYRYYRQLPTITGGAGLPVRVGIYRDIRDTAEVRSGVPAMIRDTRT